MENATSRLVWNCAGSCTQRSLGDIESLCWPNTHADQTGPNHLAVAVVANIMFHRDLLVPERLNIVRKLLGLGPREINSAKTARLGIAGARRL